jgi:hypothetical protein
MRRPGRPSLFLPPYLTPEGAPEQVGLRLQMQLSGKSRHRSDNRPRMTLTGKTDHATVGKNDGLKSDLGLFQGKKWLGVLKADISRGAGSPLHEGPLFYPQPPPIPGFQGRTSDNFSLCQPHPPPTDRFPCRLKKGPPWGSSIPKKGCLPVLMLDL